MDFYAKSCHAGTACKQTGIESRHGAKKPLFTEQWLFVILNSPLLSRNGNSRGGVIPIHGKAECVTEVAQLEIIIAADGVGGEGKRLSVEVDGGVRERGSLVAGGQGSLLAADRRVRGSALRRSTLPQIQNPDL